MTFVIKICCGDAATGEQRCCTDTVRIKLPECPPQRCAIVRADSVKCFTHDDGSQSYGAWLSVTNLGISPAAKYLLLSASGVTFTPSTVNLGSLPISATAGVYVTFTGPAPGPLMIYVTLCDSTRQYCCRDSFQIKVPQCQTPAPDCCTNFTKRFYRLSNSASSSGAAVVGGFLRQVLRRSSR